MDKEEREFEILRSKSDSDLLAHYNATKACMEEKIEIRNQACATLSRLVNSIAVVTEHIEIHERELKAIAEIINETN